MNTTTAPAPTAKKRPAPEEQQIHPDDLALLTKNPQLLEDAIERARELDEIAAKRKKTAELAAKYRAAGMGEQEAARWAAEQMAADDRRAEEAEAALQAAITKAEREEQRRLEAERERARQEEQQRRAAELTTKLDAALGASVAAIHELFALHGFEGRNAAVRAIGAAFRKVSFLQLPLIDIYHEAKWGG